MKKKSLKISNSKIWLYVGLLLAAILLLPGILLGEGSYVQTHDQLDGEIIGYILRAKYLFQGDTIPEFMNGAYKDALTPPAPIGVLLFRFLKPYTAYEVLYCCSVLVGYFGMYLLARKIGCKRVYAMITAVLFCYLPLYPVYGLSVYGEPMLIWALVGLWTGKDRYPVICSSHQPSHYVSFLYIILYGISSSFALVGFVWVGITFLTWLCAVLACKKSSFRLGGAAFLLLLTYSLCNYSLIMQMLGKGADYVSHRTEMASSYYPDPVARFSELFFVGGDYVHAYGTAICILTIGALLLHPLTVHLYNNRIRKQAVAMGKKNGNSKIRLSGKYVLLLLNFAGMIALTAFAAWWKSEAGLMVRENMGGIWQSFQADRVYWLLPALWYLCLAYVLYLATEWKPIDSTIINSNMPARDLDIFRAHRVVKYTLIWCIIIIQSVVILKESLLNINARLLLLPDYDRITWEDYYAEELFDEIKLFIGKPRDSYRCVSIGIDPAAALYNGFYCLDGYSNMYDLEYKHAFREIIADEIEASEYLQFYFDQWGNRCYVFNHQTLDDITIGKDSGITLTDLSINTRALKNMGCKYIFSAVPIENADSLGIVLAREEPFETPDSYYAIYLYEVK